MRTDDKRANLGSRYWWILFVAGVSGLSLIAGIWLSRDERAPRFPDNTRPLYPFFAYAGHPAISPSGEWRLSIDERLHNDDSCLYHGFIVENKTSDDAWTAEFSSTDDYSTNHGLYILWDDDDRVWVNSSDVGTFYWYRTESGEWRKEHYEDGAVPYPPRLRTARLERYHFKP